MTKLAIFASGTGTNAREIIAHFANQTAVEIALIVTNKTTAGVIELAKTKEIPYTIISRSSFYQTEDISNTLKMHDIDWVILAGFLWLIPEYLINDFPNRIVNIHPALLPKYGGKGMYGKYVHEAVKRANEKQSGITIHYVNGQYDEGQIIFQTTCELEESDDSISIAQKVLKLEHHYFPRVIQSLIQDRPLPSILKS